MVKLTPIIQVLAAIITIFAMINWLMLTLSEQIRHYVPAVLVPITSYMDAVLVFGVGAGVYCLATMAANGKK
jgi:hypothetical protein